MPKLVDIKTIHKELQPGVISEQMISECVMNQNYKGESARLAKQDVLQFNKVYQIRLEMFSKNNFDLICH